MDLDNEELEATKNKLQEYIRDNYISKDKIRKHIKELESRRKAAIRNELIKTADVLLFAINELHRLSGE